MKPAFDQLSECLDQSLVNEQTALECAAMELCGDHLKIYEVTLDKCRRYLLSFLDTDSLCAIALTLADIQLKLSESEVQHGNLSGAVSAIMEGLAIERSQYVCHGQVTVSTFSGSRETRESRSSVL